MQSYDKAIAEGETSGSALFSAVENAPGEARLIVEHWANDQVAIASTNLSPGQQSFYKDQLMNVVPGSDKANETKSDETLRTLNDEGIERSSEIASLIQRAASQNRPDLIQLIGQYNRAKRADPLQKP